MRRCSVADPSENLVPKLSKLSSILGRHGAVGKRLVVTAGRDGRERDRHGRCDGAKRIKDSYSSEGIGMGRRRGVSEGIGVGKRWLERAVVG